MKHYFSLVAVTTLVLVGCGQNSKPIPVSIQNPTQVNPTEVQSIVLTKDAESAENCAAEIQKQGATVLYRNATGALFVNKQLSQLKSCQGTVTRNQTYSMPQTPAATGKKKVNLKTLLKLLPAEEIGARSFIEKNPTFDGRGAIVAILDTGVELDHPMLRKTSDDKVKVIAAQDFSGQGRVNTAQVKVSAQGTFDVDGATYIVGTDIASDFQFGIFPGSTLVYNAEISAGDVFSDIGLVVYRNPLGELRAKVDANNNKDFRDDKEVATYDESHSFIKLGEKGTLNAAVNIDAEANVVTLAFDDGSHGTHVAGISTGNDPEGLVGVAPGAQVISAKIGDNRLAGGSTTTASMMLAIDYAVAKGAQVINLSYGIRSGSNLGASAIDQYVDKVARESGVIFSISAGNEGPGLLTVGTPAGAELAISNAAYLSVETAANNYGYVNFARNNTWYFSSVGPQMNGGFKPTLLAPGTALSSIPPWGDGHATYSGTSMASPEVTGGLALILSAASQSNLPTDRATVTRAVYLSAKPVEGLMLIEQGYGLMSVPAAVETLKTLKDTLTVEYSLAVTSPTSPTGVGKGIYVRSDSLPGNLFSVQVSPSFPKGTSADVKKAVRTYELKPSAPWIRTAEAFYLTGSARLFRVDVDPSILLSPGVHSEKIEAIDDDGLVAFTVPVTIVAPEKLNEKFAVKGTTSVAVGETIRKFVYLPAGTTAVQVDLISDGPTIGGQLLDAEGRTVLELGDRASSPQPPMLKQVNVTTAGVYELDIIAPGSNRETAEVDFKIQAFSLSVRSVVPSSPDDISFLVENYFAPLKIASETSLVGAGKTRLVPVKGTTANIAFEITQKDLDEMSEVRFRVRTSKEVYDMMTDYPYMIFGPKKDLMGQGGLQLDDLIHFDRLNTREIGNYVLDVTGAFTDKAPESWVFELTEERLLNAPVSVGKTGVRGLERGQQMLISVDVSDHRNPLRAGLSNCFSMMLKDGLNRDIQSQLVCE